MAGKIGGTHAGINMPEPPAQNFGTISGIVDADSLPANHPGNRADQIPGQVEPGSCVYEQPEGGEESY